MPKLHISLDVTDLERSLAFYRAFFGVEPVKLKPDYAKFDLAEPAVNFTLNVRPFTPGGALNHLGIQVEDSRLVHEAQARLQAAGLLTTEELNTTCCYALQDKIWVQDPDGHDWEVFHVLQADAEPEAEGTACCVPLQVQPGLACCTPEVKEEAVVQGQSCCG